MPSTEARMFLVFTRQWIADAVPSLLLQWDTAGMETRMMPSYITEQMIAREIMAEIESVTAEELARDATEHAWEMAAMEAEIMACEG